MRNVNRVYCLTVPKGEYLQYGGQAIIEGVMMRSPKFFSVACRAPNQQIVLRTEAIEKTWIGRQKWLKLPFLRGALAILDSMALGLRSMRFASNVQLDEEYQPLETPGSGAETPLDPAVEQAGKATKAAKAPSAKMQDGLIIGTMIVSVVIGLFIFQYLPNLISAGIAGNPSLKATYTQPDGVTAASVRNKLQDAGMRDVKVTEAAGQFVIELTPSGKLRNAKTAEATEELSKAAGLAPSSLVSSVHKGVPDWRTNLITEIIKIIMFIGYIWLISRLPEIQRVFQYHGAEHKAINTLEANQELTFENCKAQTRLHPRCGTSFAVIVLIVSLAIFTFIPRPDLPWLIQSLVRFLVEIPLLLVVAGISYELIRIAGKFRSQKWVGVLFWPGLMTQYITTSEPDEDQIEVALQSLKAAIAAEESGIAPSETQVLGEPKAAAAWATKAKPA